MQDYLEYSKMHPQPHKVIDGGMCEEAGNTFEVVKGTDCNEFKQMWGDAKNPTVAMRKCAKNTKFDARVCSCAWTNECHEQ